MILVVIKKTKMVVSIRLIKFGREEDHDRKNRLTEGWGMEILNLQISTSQNDMIEVPWQ